LLQSCLSSANGWRLLSLSGFQPRNLDHLTLFATMSSSVLKSNCTLCSIIKGEVQAYKLIEIGYTTSFLGIHSIRPKAMCR
ncbi:hypothetical protein DL89DRAFT_304810, partial [Linderina pennispora]